MSGSNHLRVTGKAHAKPSGHLVFVVHNHSRTSHTVRVPADSFRPKRPKGTKTEGAPHPIGSGQKQSVTVAAFDAGVIRLKVRPKGHFKKGDWTYKYSVRWAAPGKKAKVLDPQIEINN
jgi:hypothetical protein